MANHIVSHKGRGKGGGGHLYVPQGICAVIPESAYFEAEVTDDGILYRFVGHRSPSYKPVTTPKWAESNAKPSE